MLTIVLNVSMIVIDNFIHNAFSYILKNWFESFYGVTVNDLATKEKGISDEFIEIRVTALPAHHLLEMAKWNLELYSFNV